MYAMPALLRTVLCSLLLLAIAPRSAPSTLPTRVRQAGFDVIISEIMYNPPDYNGADGALFEFLELSNRGTAAVDLSSASFSDGIDFTFPVGTQLAPGAYLVLASSAINFTNVYGFAPAGEYAGKLNNGGEHIALANSAGTLVAEVTYGSAAPWPVAADGCGYSLVFQPATANTAQDDPVDWQRSTAIYGSPGTADPPLAAAPILINEALTHTDPPQQDTIELYNPAGIPVDVGGWFLTDDSTQPDRFRIPDCTWVDANGFRLFTEDKFNFSLSALGEEVYLVAADVHGGRLGYTHGFEFGVTPNGVSLGRHVISTGEEHFPLQIATTLGTPNAGPWVGPVVISELMYRPAAGNDEYIQLANISIEYAPLYDPAHPENVWRLDGIDSYAFPANTSIPPGGRLLVVPLAPGTFRERYAIPDSVQIVGPYAGQLSDNGERIELMRPDTPNTDGTVPYFAADTLTYANAAPWPTAANGTGFPLVRIYRNRYGDDPANWRAGGSIFLPLIR